MKVTVEEAGPCRKLMEVDVPPDAVAPDYEETLQAYARAAKIPGFRKSKAPVDVVERRYRKAIEEDARSRLVPRFYREALKQEQIEPVAIVGVSDIGFDKTEGLSFKVTVDVAPEFKLPKYRKIRVEARKSEVTDEHVDAQLERMRESCARYEDVQERGLRRGDLAALDYRGTCEGTPIGELAADCSGLDKGENFWVLLSEPEYLPGFNEGLQDARIGETRTIDVVFPSDYHVPAVAGKAAVYEVEVKGIRERELPDVNEEFLKQLNVDSEDALRQRIRRELETEAERRDRAHLHNEIGKYLLAKTSFDLPQSLVEQETRLMARNIVRRIGAQGGSPEQINGQRDAIANEAERSSKDKVRLGYILNRIAAEESIHVDDSEVDSRIGRMAEQYRMTPAQLQEELEKRNALESVRSDIRIEKTMDFLLGSAKIK